MLYSQLKILMSTDEKHEQLYELIKIFYGN